MIHIIYIAFITVILGLYLRDYFEMKKRVKDADAREQGLDEIEEGYQAEIMTLEDRLEATEERIHNVYEAHRLMKEDKDNSEIQYEATIKDLKGQIDAYREVAIQKETELRDVQQAGLEMQLELTRPEGKSPGQIYEETKDAIEKSNNA